MEPEMTLDMLSPGDTAVVRLINDRILRSRLLALGFTEGGSVRCSYTAPSGDPVAYEYAAGCIALRRSEARRVELWG